jgi:hypothetical protein
MSTAKLLATLSLGLITAGCVSQTYDRQAPAPSNISRVSSSSERDCLDYGFTPGTASYDRCVQRDAHAREAGRMNRDYDQARLSEDARSACYDYGLTQGTPRYDNCVAREVDARRYREQGQMSAPTQTYTYTQYSAPAYTPDPYVVQQPAATSGQQAFHDEYGFRYDAQGDRLDRNGRIISPQDTTP